MAKQLTNDYVTEYSTRFSNVVFNLGYTILADCRFNIQDSVNLYCLQLAHSTLRKRNTELEGFAACRVIKNIANIRIHVKSVVGTLRKKLSPLSDTQPFDFVTSPH